MTQIQTDAKALERYIQTHFYENGDQPLPRNEVLRNGPIRPASRYDEVLDYLTAGSKVWIGRLGRRRFIYRGPNFGAL